MGTVYITSTRRLMATYRPLTLTTVQSVMGFLFFVPFAGVEAARQLPALSLGGLAAVGFLGVCASVGAILSFNKALSLMEAGRASLFLNVIPVISLLFGWLLLGERLTSLQLVAAAVVIGGVTVGSWKTAGQPSPEMDGALAAAHEAMAEEKGSG
jgi:drug/metabolite transporter (DMT)-like permease